MYILYIHIYRALWGVVACCNDLRHFRSLKHDCCMQSESTSRPLEAVTLGRPWPCFFRVIHTALTLRKPCWMPRCSHGFDWIFMDIQWCWSAFHAMGLVGVTLMGMATFVSSSRILGSDSKKWADSKIAGEHFNIESPLSLRQSLKMADFNVWATPLQSYWQSITLKFTVSSKTSTKIHVLETGFGVWKSRNSCV